MNNLRAIRKHIKLSQAELAKLIGCTQGNIGHYESKNQTIKPDVAQKILAVAKDHGLVVSLEYLYGDTTPGSKPPVEQDRKQDIQLMFDAFGSHHIMVNGRTFITINYIAQHIDNAGMRSLSGKILSIVKGDQE